MRRDPWKWPMCSGTWARFRRQRDGALPRLSSKVLRPSERCRTAALGGHVEALRPLRPPAHRLQLLPQSALSQVPGAGHGPLAGSPGRPSCCRCLLSPGLHAAATNRATLALQNPRVVYGLLLRAAAETLAKSPPIPKHLGAEIGPGWCCTPGAQNLTHHPHVHGVVPAAASPPTVALGRVPHGFLPAGARAQSGCSAASFFLEAFSRRVVVTGCFLR